jgi:hypothetical protein
MPRSLQFARLGRCAACLLGLALLAACAEADDTGQAQSFAAHLNGSYTAAAVATSVR